MVNFNPSSNNPSFNPTTPSKPANNNSSAGLHAQIFELSAALRNPKLTPEERKALQTRLQSLQSELRKKTAEMLFKNTWG